MKTDWLLIGAISLGCGAAVSALFGESTESAIMLVGMWITMGFSHVVAAISGKG